MTNTNDIRQIEITIEQTKDQIAKMECLERLRKNKDFKELIEVGYLKDEAVSLVLARAEPQLQPPEQYAQVDKMIDGVGYFRQYLNKVYQMGYAAERALDEHLTTRDELMSEV